jgi:hypothetical protein
MQKNMQMSHGGISRRVVPLPGNAKPDPSRHSVERERTHEPSPPSVNEPSGTPQGFGVRQSSGAFRTAAADSKAPEDWRSPRRCRGDRQPRGSRREEAHFNFGFRILAARSRRRSGSDFGFFRQSLLTSAATAAFVLLLTTFAHAQNSQFLFDPNGNLLAQTAEVVAPPQIIGQPQNQIVAPGGAASFFVVAADTRALTYQ